MGSMPNLDRRMRGVEVEMSVGRIEWRNVAGTIETGNIHEPRDRIVAKIDRGTSAAAVSNNFVLVMSNGARIRPAIPEADTETRRESHGDGEDMTSSRVRDEDAGKLVIAV